MKPKIWNEEEAKTADNDQLFFKLGICPSHGDIHVIVVNKEGEQLEGGHLIMFEFDLQCVVISNGVNPKIPLKTGIDNDLIYIEENEFRERHKEEMHKHIMKQIINSKQEYEQPVSKH